MSRPTTRVLELLELLQDRRSATGPEIAARLGVDLRTVRRYVTKLEELGIPVEATRGRSGGYRLRPGYRLPPLMLTDAEATAVVLGLLAARRAGLAGEQAAVEGALEKLRRVLPESLRERVRALEGALGFTRGAAYGALTAGVRDGAGGGGASGGDASGGAETPEVPATPTLLALADAIGRERRVRIAYRGREGAASTRVLEPYGLVFHGGRWYLAARDRARDALRTFRVDRVASVEILATPAVPPPGFDAVAHVSRSLARVPWTHAVEVRFPDASLEELRAQLPPHAAELEQLPEAAGGGVLLRARVERLDGMARLLAGLGAPFEVHEPAALRDALGTIAARLTAAARPADG